MTDSEPESGADRPLAASVEKLRHELDHWLGVAWSRGERALDSFGLATAGSWLPAFDVVETPDEIRVLVDLPGVDRDAIDVSLTGNMLTVRGERPAISLDEEHVAHARHRASGSFSRSIPMPAPVNDDDISAEVLEGVLTVLLAKSDEAKPRKITITEGSPVSAPSPE
jgi:HSP20 family protein